MHCCQARKQKFTDGIGEPEIIPLRAEYPIDAGIGEIARPLHERSDERHEQEHEQLAHEYAEHEEPVDILEVDGHQVQEDERGKGEVGREVVQTFDVRRWDEVAATRQKAIGYYFLKLCFHLSLKLSFHEWQTLYFHLFVQTVSDPDFSKRSMTFMLVSSRNVAK